MFDTAQRASWEHRLGVPAKLALAGAVAFTLLAGGTALAAGSTSSQTPIGQSPAAQSLLRGDSRSTNATDPEGESAEGAGRAADESKADTTARGVHGACVSRVAHDRSTVGRDHGAAVSAAAHSCPKGSDAASGPKKSATGKVKCAEKSAVGKTKCAEKSGSGKAHGKG